MAYQCTKCGQTSVDGPRGAAKKCSFGGNCVWNKISRFVKQFLNW